MRVNFMARAAQGLLLGVLGLGFGGGCGEDDGLGAHIPVSGHITLDGAPLKSGNIVFTPVQVGRGTQAKVVDGAFSIPGSQGPSPATYRVEIYSIQPTGKKVFDRGENELIEETRNLIPPKYNSNSTLQAVVKNEGDNTFDFPLESAAGKTK